MKNELTYLRVALMFYTRIPVGEIKDWQDDYLHKSRKYFPVVGYIVGGFSALVLYAFYCILPPAICVLLAMLASVILTGAFHEDGLADTFDAFGGGWEKEQILKIMKDSRIGTYGTVALVFSLGLKFLLLLELSKISLIICLVALLNAHVLSRFMASLMMQFAEYVQDTDQSKSKPMASQKLSIGALSFTILLTLPIFFLWQNLFYLLIFPISLFVMLYMMRYFKKRIGGYTGDALGATQQITELFIYLTVLIITQF